MNNVIKKNTIIRNQYNEIPRSDKHFYAMTAFDNISDCIDLILKGCITGKEKDWSRDQHAPLAWIYGNILYFWDRYFVRIVYSSEPIIASDRMDNIYNHLISKESRFSSRFKLKLIDIYDLLVYADTIWIYIEKWLLHSPVQSEIHKSAFNICLLYTFQEIETMLCDYQLLGKSNPIYTYPFNLPAKVDPIPVKFITIKGGKFRQGSPSSTIFHRCDNEMPSFVTCINDFVVSKYLITQGQFLAFVEDSGYKTLKYWSSQGKQWLKFTKVSMPIYWKLENGVWYRKLFDKWIILEPNKPMIHVNMFEAEAYCSWASGRLLTESEWEYLATEGGYALDIPTFGGNIGMENYDTTTVESDPINSFGISSLIGNCWCWCSDLFMPYDGYKSDKIYPEGSALNFGNQYVIRGGSWASQRLLTSKTYRNSLLPETRKQYTGFRIARTIER